MPSMHGMWMSIRTTSGWSASARGTAVRRAGGLERHRAPYVGLPLGVLRRPHVDHRLRVGARAVERRVARQPALGRAPARDEDDGSVAQQAISGGQRVEPVQIEAL